MADIFSEVIAGLSRSDKQISPKFFYDEAGSSLFEAITDLPEYYLTRTELELFDTCLGEIATLVGSGGCLVEYGSGSSLKVRRVLEYLEPHAYVPVDISADHLTAMAEALFEDFPDLEIYPTGADFSRAFALPEPVSDLAKLGFFPGSSIGNFEPDDAVEFLRNLRQTLGSGCRLIVGVDRKKDVQVLEAAYNDSLGVTAEFNLNLLRHLGEMLDADLDPARFRHRAVFNEQIGAIQMFLDVLETHSVRIADTVIEFTRGEAVHTENSFKYQPEEFVALAGRAGFESIASWTDARAYFSVFLFEAPSIGE